MDAYPYTDIILVILHLACPGAPDHTHVNGMNQMNVFIYELISEIELTCCSQFFWICMKFWKFSTFVDC